MLSQNIDEPWEPEGSMKLPQSIDPNGNVDMSQYDAVLITDAAIKAGTVFYWACTDCVIERVTKVGTQHTLVNYIYHGSPYTGTFENWQTLKVKRTQQGGESDEH